MTRRARAVAAAVALAMTFALPIDRSNRGYAAEAPGWTEVAWPFPMDQWGQGSAFRCKAADCGAEITVYLRPKIGFCNCTTGVSDDAELERVADVSLFDDRFHALAGGRAIKVGHMTGRSRPYVVDVGAGAKVLAIAFNERCDVIVATAHVAQGEPARFEDAVLAFLNGERALKWAEAKLGL